MSISLYKLKKWCQMVLGKSIQHVNQDMGKNFVVGELNGYFNNLTEKVSKDPESLKAQKLPTAKSEDGKVVVFPITIFQYGLGAYDLFLQTDKKIYLSQFYLSANWALNNQKANGAWDNFSFVYPDNPYSAMCQGEGASLLLRAWKQSGLPEYFNAAKKSIDFMLLPSTEGGTSLYTQKGLTLLEYTHLPVVLNGWVFAAFGLYDMALASGDDVYVDAWNSTIVALTGSLHEFDNGYWSMYDYDKKIASPFYHNLHIAQLEALYAVTGASAFMDLRDKFVKYRACFWNRSKAFIIKAIQKLKE